MSVLEELYNGNINPSEKFIKKGSEYDKLTKQFSDCSDKLMKLLNNEQKALLNESSDIMSNLCYINEKEAFTEGFCIGAQMILDIMNFNSKNFSFL